MTQTSQLILGLRVPAVTLGDSFSSLEASMLIDQSLQSQADSLGPIGNCPIGDQGIDFFNELVI